MYLADQRGGLPPEVVDKLRKMLAFLQEMGSVHELRTLPAWKAHQLRDLTFRIADDELVEVDRQSG